jgi:phage tail-like protein
MATGDRRDPYGAFRFHLEIDSVIVAGFSDVSGLSVETDSEEKTEGGVNDHVHTFVKGTKHPRLVLKHGITDSDSLWSWHQDVVGGRIKRQNGRILLFDTTGQEKWRWNFQGAFPLKWIGPDLKAESASVAIESIELVHQGLTKG